MFSNKIKPNQEHLAKKLSSLSEPSNHAREAYLKTMSIISNKEATAIYQQRQLLEANDSFEKKPTPLFSKYKNFLSVGLVAIVIIVGGFGISSQLHNSSGTNDNIQTIPADGTIESTISSINTDYTQEASLVDQSFTQAEESAEKLGSTASQIGDTSNANTF